MLDDEFLLYCKMNNIDDVDKLAKETFNRGFTILKYGETPLKISAPEPKVVEKIKEVQVEKIVEKIKEVPVEKIVEKIKEVPVEKIVEIIKEAPKEKHFEKVIIEKYKDTPQQKGNERLTPRVPRERGDDKLYDE